MDDPQPSRPCMVGINHVALEVGVVEAALRFYGSIFDVRLRGRIDGGAFVDLGDQFLALMEGPPRAPRGQRHLGLVVDDRASVRALAQAAGAEILPGSSLDFLDPWGNCVEVVEYGDVQFTKADAVLRGMGLGLAKSEKALADLERKAFARASDGRGEVSRPARRH